MTIERVKHTNVKQDAKTTKKQSVNKKNGYRERTIEHIHDHNNNKCLCECGLVCTHVNKARHLRSEDHKRQVEKKDDPNYLLCECGAVVCKMLYQDIEREVDTKRQWKSNP